MCDGDKALVVQDRTLTAIAKRNMKGIVPLYYEMKKAKGGAITSESLYEGMINAYTGGNIGIYSNNITKIWNCGKPIEEEQLKAVKWLVMENNFVIDFAKTLFKMTRPEEVDKIIKSYTSSKVPAFFVHAKDKDQSQVEPANESTMNRFMSKVPSSRMKYCKTIGKMDYRMLMNQDCDFTVKENPIVEEYNYWVTHQLPVSELNEEIEDEDLWINKQIRKRFEEYGSLDYVVNTLVNYCYTIKRGSSKKLLWNCFGDVIVENLRKNTASLGNICPICGKRFKPTTSLQVCCSEECHKISRTQQRYELRKKL